jgi:uncharacterized protein YggU (UPF0235/DUF167 family)
MSKTVKVKVVAGAKKERLEEEKEGVFTIAVRERAERNEANTRVRELVAEYFAVPVGKVKMVAGHRSPTKWFEIHTS